jgi:D-alanine-D-alanine ligase-like ATP-grasp enzyme
LEVNPIPGFTSASGYARLWKATTGWTPSQICEELIVLALHRARRLAKLRVAL